MKIKEAIRPNQAWAEHDLRQKQFEEEIQDHAQTVEESVDLLVTHPEYWGQICTQQRTQSKQGKPLLVLTIQLQWVPAEKFVEVHLGGKKIITIPPRFVKSVQEQISINYRKHGWHVEISDERLVLGHERELKEALVVEKKQSTSQGFEYLVNPLGPELIALMKQSGGEVRGFVDLDNGDTYFWAATDTIHVMGRMDIMQENPGIGRRMAWVIVSLTEKVETGESWNHGAMQPLGPVWIGIAENARYVKYNQVQSEQFRMLTSSLSRMSESVLSEKKMTMGGLTYLRNPLGRELLAFINQCEIKELRGIITPKDDWYFWEAAKADHSRGQYLLGESSVYSLVVSLTHEVATDLVWNRTGTEFGPVWISAYKLRTGTMVPVDEIDSEFTDILLNSLDRLQESRMDEIRMVDEPWAKRLQPPYADEPEMISELYHSVKDWVQVKEKGVQIGYISHRDSSVDADWMGLNNDGAITIWDKDILVGYAGIQVERGMVSINTPTLKNAYRKKQLGMLFYQYILDHHKRTIISHQQQTPGSAMVWSMLKRNPAYSVMGVTARGKRIPVIADGPRLYIDDRTVYDDPEIVYLICEPVQAKQEAAKPKLDEEVYGDDEEEPYKPEMITLKQGTRLFHGTSSSEFENDLDYPAWVSNSPVVAKNFSTWNSHDEPQPRVMEYTLNWDVELVLFRDSSDMKQFFESLGEDSNDSPRELAEVMCRRGYQGWIVPDNYPEGHDILLCHDCLTHVRTEQLTERAEARMWTNPSRSELDAIISGAETYGDFRALLNDKGVSVWVSHHATHVEQLRRGYRGIPFSFQVQGNQALVSVRKRYASQTQVIQSSPWWKQVGLVPVINVLESKEKLLDQPTPDLKQIASKHGVSLDYIQAQLKQGIRIEHEHTQHADVAREIALDHLNERPDYYERLKKVENESYLLYSKYPELTEKEEWRGPHQDRELELMLAGTKPLAIVDPNHVEKFLPHIKAKRLVGKKIYLGNPRHKSLVVALPDQASRIDRLEQIYADVRAQNKMTLTHHREIGNLLGYDPGHVDKFLDYMSAQGVTESQEWEIPARKTPGVIYRGMSQAEYQNILQTGQIAMGIHESILEEGVEDMTEWYLEGGCLTLAFAINHLTGYPVMGLSEKDGGDFVHFAIQLPDGRGVDASGIKSLDDIAGGYVSDPEWTEVNAYKFITTSGATEQDIDQAVEFARKVFGKHLPLKESILEEGVEDKLAKLRTNYIPRKLKELSKTNTDTDLNNKDHQNIAGFLFDQLVRVDPSQQKKYMSWIIQWDLAGGKQEDQGKLHDYLDVLNRGRVRGFDINRVKTLPELYQAVAPYLETQTQGQISKQERVEIDQQTITVFKGPQGQIVIPKTKLASCFWGKGTQWCTAGEKYNAFDDYREFGPLYVIMLPSGEKYQIQFGSGQFMDPTDKSVRDIDGFIAKHPWVKTALKMDMAQLETQLEYLKKYQYEYGDKDEQEYAYLLLAAFTKVPDDEQEMLALYERHPNLLRYPRRFNDEQLFKIIMGAVEREYHTPLDMDALRSLIVRIANSGRLSSEAVDYLVEKAATSLASTISRMNDPKKVITDEQLVQLVRNDPHAVKRLIKTSVFSDKLITVALQEVPALWNHLYPYMGSDDFLFILNRPDTDAILAKRVINRWVENGHDDPFEVMRDALARDELNPDVIPGEFWNRIEDRKP